MCATESRRVFRLKRERGTERKKEKGKTDVRTQQEPIHDVPEHIPFFLLLWISCKLPVIGATG